MLWALALLGMLPAAFVFGEGEPDEADNDSDGVNASKALDQDGSVADILDEGGVEDVSEEDSELQSVHYDAVSNGLEATYDDFAVGEDAITLHLTDDGSGEFIADTMQDEEGDAIGVSLSYFGGETETTLSFVGLDEVPAEDILIGVTSQETGEETLYSLDDFDAILPDDPDMPATPGGESIDLALAPSDPDVPATPSGISKLDDPVLTPSSPSEDDQVFDHALADGGDTLVLNDDPFQGGFDADIVTSGGAVSIETDNVLHQVTGSDDADTIVLGDDAAMVQAGSGDDTIYIGEGTAIVSAGDGDDAIYGGDDFGSDYLLAGGAGDDILSGGEADEVLIGGLGADTISGGGGDDTLALDQQDIATGGSGDDTFWLYSDGLADADFAQILDFEQGEDLIRITLPTEAEGADNLDVEIAQTEDGSGSRVSVNGDVVAVLYGAPNVTASDVVIDYTT
jgi:Ca2+-binding RTX toxin-like protein